MLPEVFVEEIEVEQTLGFATYSLVAKYTNMGSQQKREIKGRLVRGNISWEKSCFNRPDGNSFAWFQMPEIYLIKVKEVG